LLSDFEALMADESLVDADVRMTNQRSPVGRYLDRIRISFFRLSIPPSRGELDECWRL
jgi:hypothetical protein